MEIGIISAMQSHAYALPLTTMDQL